MLSRSIVGYPVMALVLSLLLASSLKVAAFVPRTTVGAATVGRRGIASATASPSALPFQASNCRHRGVAPVTQLQALPSGGGGGVDTGSLTTFFLQTLIANGIPALFTIAVIGFAATMFRKKDSSSSNTNRSMVSSLNNPAAKLYNDLYGDQEQEATTASSGLRRLFGSSSNNNNNVSLPKNTGVPARQYIKLTNWNRKLDSYQYSVTAAVQSQAAAAAAYRQGSLNRALQQATKLSSTTTTATATSNLSPSALRKLQEAEQHFLSQGAALQQDILDLQTKLTAAAVDEELAGMGVADAYELDPAELESADPANTTSTAVVTNSAKGKTVKKKKGKTRKQVNAWMTALTTAQRELQQTELDFIQDLVAAVGPSRAAAVRTALTGDTAGRGAGGLLLKLQATGDRPLLSALLDPNATNKPSSVFVMRFPGDASASQVAELREEVTAVVRQAAAGDEAVVILQTGGGTVTGYGLAAAQLMRFKEAGMKLTVAVEQVAASGGYMMCCVADRIVASPFAVLGSIGVISDIPNVYERLKKEGIEFQTVTAGKYKRTLTPTKKPTKGDFVKTKQDVQDIFELFRDFVKQNRPQLDIEKVATGETWFGTDAMELGLCDEIKTVDSLLTDFVDANYQVYEVEYELPQENALSSLLPIGVDSKDQGILGRGIRWLVRAAAAEVKAELGTNFDLNQSVEKRYMAIDDSANRVRSQD